jgi:hypothetical protein
MEDGMDGVESGPGEGFQGRESEDPAKMAGGYFKDDRMEM